MIRSSNWSRFSCQLALALRAEVGQTRPLALRLDADWRTASRARSSASSVNGVSVTAQWCQQTATHQVPRRQVQLSKELVIDHRRRLPRIDPVDPQRLAFVDIADAGANTLVKEEFPNGGRRCPGTSNYLIEVKGLDQDVRAQMSDRLLGIGHEFHLWCSETHRHNVIEAKHHGRGPGRLSPALAQPIQMP